MELNEILKKIKMFVMDVDGVLTDGGMYYSENGVELKKFNTRDGKGIELLRKAGFKVAIITSENTKIVAMRASKLQISEIYQGVENKREVLENLALKYNLNLNEIAYIGDDVNDLPCLEIVGFPASVADGLPQVRKTALYVTEKKGGEGAVREVAEMILAAQGKSIPAKEKSGQTEE